MANVKWTSPAHRSPSQFAIHRAALYSVTHFGPQRIRTLGDQAKTNGGTAVRALGANRGFVHGFILVGLQPHESEALGTTTDLC